MGRTFHEHDTAKSLPVAVINQSMARHHWRSEDPIGKRITLDNGKTWVTLVGMVGDVREYGLDRPVGDQIYLPGSPIAYVNNLLVRTGLDPMALTPLDSPRDSRGGPADCGRSHRHLVELSGVLHGAVAGNHDAARYLCRACLVNQRERHCGGDGAFRHATDARARHPAGAWSIAPEHRRKW